MSVSFTKKFSRVWNNSRYRAVFLVSLVLSLLMIMTGLLGLNNVLYARTGATIEKDIIIMSDHDDSIMYLNYFTPRAEIQTDVGVILAHGFSSDRWSFQEMTAVLVEAGMNVAVFDERGHGDSWGIKKDKIGWEGQNNEERAAQAQGDLKAIHDFLVSRGSKHIIVIGHSMGGLNSIWFGCEYPKLIDATIAIGAAGPDVDPYLTTTSPPNLLIIRGQNEELFSNTDALNTISHALKDEGQVSPDDLEINTLYGDFADGTARKLSVVSGNGYTGHIQEISEPRTFLEILDWIEQAGDSKGFNIDYDASMDDAILQRSQEIKRYDNFANLGIFLAFIPFSAIIGSFAISSMPSLQKEMEFLVDEKEVNLIKFYFIITLLGAVAGVGTAFMAHNLSLFQFFYIKYSNFVVGTFLGFGALLHIALLMLKRKHDFRKEAFESDESSLGRKALLVNVVVGIYLGVLYGLLNYFLLNSFGFAHIAGSIPLKPWAWLTWIVFSMIFIIVLIPDEIFLRSIQSKLQAQHGFINGAVKLTIKNFLLKIPVWVIIAMVFFIIPPDLMTVYVVGSFVLLAFLEMVSIYLYAITRSIVVTVLFNGISLGWFIMSMLPFVY